VGQHAEFQITGDEPQTLLVRAFDAPVGEVFAAWTRAELLRQWYGPHVTTVSECFMDTSEGGSYRITMRTRDGTEFPLFGTVHNVRAPYHLELVMDLSEHPDDFVHSFRPRGSEIEFVPLRWYYDIDFHEDQGVTTVTILATYPVLEDRDAMIAMNGEVGWNESFERLDALLRSP
jgi:uncharacterized protein YndB with AHSA1/START domain